MVPESIQLLPPWKVIGNSYGEGGGSSSYTKLLGEKYEAKLDFLGGGEGVQNNKTFHSGGVWIFLELHNAKISTFKVCLELQGQTTLTFATSSWLSLLKCAVPTM